MKQVFLALFFSVPFTLPDRAESTFFLSDATGIETPAQAKSGAHPEPPPLSERVVEDPKFEAVCVSDKDFEKATDFNDAIGKSKRLVVGDQTASFHGSMMTFKIKYRHLDTIIMEVDELLGRPGDGGSDYWGRAVQGEIVDADLLTLKRGYLDLVHGDFWVTQFQAEQSDRAGGPRRGFSVIHYSCVFSF